MHTHPHMLTGTAPPPDHKCAIKINTYWVSRAAPSELPCVFWRSSSKSKEPPSVSLQSEVNSMSCYLVVLSVDIAVDPALLWELSSFSQLLPNQNTELPAKGREDLSFVIIFLRDYTVHLREFPPYSLLASSWWGPQAQTSIYPN